MILVDANIILYAEDSASPHHVRAREWWDALLSGADEVALCWPVLKAFLRIATHPKLQVQPVTPRQACDRISEWLAQPGAMVVEPTDRHWDEFRRLVLAINATGNLITDAHLAAMAIGHGCQLASCDADFSKFPGLNWVNPLAS